MKREGKHQFFDIDTTSQDHNCNYVNMQLMILIVPVLLCPLLYNTGEFG